MAAKKGAVALTAPPKKSMGQRLKDSWQLYLLLLIPVVLTFIYKYIPMYGIQIAFRDFNARLGYFGSPWVGMKWFQRFFAAPYPLIVYWNETSIVLKQVRYHGCLKFF